jgi:large subunit ribosomal protein L23
MIIKGFQITEKSTRLVEDNKYTFWVDKDSTKNQIGSEIEDRFNVKVVSVNVINQKGKIKTLGRQSGKKKDRKKAIVTIKKGQKISDFEVAE